MKKKMLTSMEVLRDFITHRQPFSIRKINDYPLVTACFSTEQQRLFELLDGVTFPVTHPGN